MNLLNEDLRKLSSLKMSLALGMKDCPTSKECYLMLESEIDRPPRPNVLNIEKVLGPIDPGSFDQWQKVSPFY